MVISKSRRDYRSRSLLLVGALLWTLCFPHGASAQQRLQRGSTNTIDAGTSITVVTSEAINAKDSDGRVFTGVVSKDVVNRNGSVAIPRGSNAGLVVKQISDSEVALDLSSVTINRQQYSIVTEDNALSSEERDGIGANQRTGEFVGGGALIGAIVGAITGGKKGALIGGGVGAAAGAGTQVLTRGRSVSVPAEAELTFRMQQPLRLGTANRSNQSSREIEPTTSAAYREGLRAGRSDWDRNLPRNTQTTRWTGQDFRDYEAGYTRGYQRDEANGSATPIREQAFIRIGADNNISWQAPANARVTVKVDNNPVRRFASGQSGTLEAPWITPGHVYLFALTDVNGTEIATDRLDTRGRR